MSGRVAAIVSALAATCAFGCRTVWVHPEATQEKYTSDFYRCRFGTEPPTAEEIRSGQLPAIAPRADWRQCMAVLGWTTEVGMRSSEPWSQ